MDHRGVRGVGALKNLESSAQKGPAQRGPISTTVISTTMMAFRICLGSSDCNHFNCHLGFDILAFSLPCQSVEPTLWI